ncbi:AraC family transcriptional regulator [Paenibacillus sp. RC67]|uniref:helix-turn-helix transcriptional regulator n=1 Tax=Paenibacillus sp. RC67 TaxID=3039392 RepID=UPI0024AC966A|nr:AraC family transcriptional regulator [Paenibacillus sp. RC67]
MIPNQVRRTDDFVNNKFNDMPISMKYLETENHFYMDFHSHQGFEIYFFIEGNGCFLIEDHIYPLEGMDLIFICPNESHKSSPNLDIPNTRSVLHFLPELLDQQTREALLEIFRQGLKYRHLRLDSSRLDRFHYLWNRLHDNYAHRPDDFLLSIRIYLSELLLEIRHYMFQASALQADQVDRSSINPKIEQAIQYISNSYSENLTLDKIAAELFLNRYYLCHLFKKTLGITISDFLLQTRFHHAKQLLIHTQMPVSEVSDKVGFNSLSYFTKAFRTYTGLTPRDYRKNNAN